MDDPADLSSQSGSGRHTLDEGSPTRNRKVEGFFGIMGPMIARFDGASGHP